MAAPPHRRLPRRLIFVVLAIVMAVAIAIWAVSFFTKKTEPGVSIQGDTVKIGLKSNRTTPYEWNYTASPEGVLSAASEEYFPDPNRGNATGVGGVTVFTFSAENDGEVTLNFAYTSETRTDEEPTTTAEYSFRVSDGEITQI